MVAELQAGSMPCRAACFSSYQGLELVVGAFEDGRIRSFALPEGGLVSTSAPAEGPLCSVAPSPHAPHILALARYAPNVVAAAGVSHCRALSASQTQVAATQKLGRNLHVHVR